jgi:hypothetical protein
LLFLSKTWQVLTCQESEMLGEAQQQWQRLPQRVRPSLPGGSLAGLPVAVMELD